MVSNRSAWSVLSRVKVSETAREVGSGANRIVEEEKEEGRRREKKVERDEEGRGG